MPRLLVPLALCLLAAALPALLAPGGRAILELGQGQRPAVETLARAAGLVATLWSSEGFRDDRQAAAYRERAQDWVARYVAEAEVGEPLGIERWVAAPVGGIVAAREQPRLDEPLQPRGQDVGGDPFF